MAYNGFPVKFQFRDGLPVQELNLTGGYRERSEAITTACREAIISEWSGAEFRDNGLGVCACTRYEYGV